MLRNRFKRVAGIVAGLAFLTSCSGNPSVAPTSSSDPQAPSTQPTPNQSAREITVTAGGACICHAPLYVGIEKGFFAKHGLNVAYRQLSGGFTALGSLQTGDADVADAAVAPAAQAISQGIDVKAVVVGNGDASGAVDTSRYFAVVAREGSGIIADDASSLKGKTVGVAVGTVAHQYLYDTLLTQAVDISKDLTIQNVQAPDLVSALQSGSVDAIVGWEPGPLQALANVDGSFVVIRGGNAMQYLFARWFSTANLNADPEKARAFVLAFIESMQFARQNPDETADIVGEEFPSLDRQIIVEALTYLSFDPRVSQVTLDAAAQAVSFARANANLNEDYSLQDHIDLDLLASVLSEHPELVADLPPIPSDAELVES